MSRVGCERSGCVLFVTIEEQRLACDDCSEHQHEYVARRSSEFSRSMKVRAMSHQPVGILCRFDLLGMSVTGVRREASVSGFIGGVER